MKALLLVEPGRIELASVAVPEPKAGEVLICVKASTTCGTDLKAFNRGHPQIPMPGPFGHEYAGTVVAAGTDAPFSPGDDVMGVHSAPCQQCYWCQNGQENLCESIMATKVLGTYAEYLLIPERIARLNLFPKSKAMSFDVASLLEPLACVAQGILEIQMASVSLGSALVIGPGAIGLMFASALKKVGFGHVTLAGRNPARLAVGERLGATVTQVSDIKLHEGRGYDVVIECTGQVEVWEASVNYVRRGGHVMLFGGCKGGTTATFDTKRLHYDQITLMSPFHFGTEAVRTAHKWLTHELDLSPLITRTATLEEGTDVFAALNRGEGIKTVFHP